MSPEITFVFLFSIATAVAIAVRRFRIPYTVALVLVGLVLGMLDVVEAPRLTRELLFAIILPGLLFEAAFNLDMKIFWQNRRTIGSLAVPGVIAAIALTAAIITPAMSWFGLDPSFDWRYGLVFGALIAATDPIAVVGLFKQLNVGHRLSTLVEGESLLNDGTSVVLFTLILQFLGGAAATLGSLATQFVLIVGGGAIIGGATGWVLSSITKRIDDSLIEITLTVIGAYGSFALAEQFHFSGVIATVTAGMVCGTLGWQSGMSASTQLAVESFWDYLAFALNSVVFLLIGFAVQPHELVTFSGLIALAFMAALAARFGVVTTAVTLLSRTSEAMPKRWTAILTWGGLRGALSMVLALALPYDFPHREQLVAMTFGVVLLSLVLQGLTMSWLLQKLGIVDGRTANLSLDHIRTDLSLVDRGLLELEAMRREHAAPVAVLNGLETRLRSRRDAACERLDALHLADNDLQRDANLRAVRRLLIAERAALADAAGEGGVRREVAEAMRKDVDARLATLGTDPPTPADELLMPDEEIAALIAGPLRPPTPPNVTDQN